MLYMFKNTPFNLDILTIHKFSLLRIILEQSGGGECKSLQSV
jgi:hypothetical protein